MICRTWAGVVGRDAKPSIIADSLLTTAMPFFNNLYHTQVEDIEMTPSEAERDLLFKQFGRAFFKEDLDALYAVVTENFTYSILVNDVSRVMRSKDEVAAFFQERKSTQKDVRFEDVVFHHALEATFMTYRVTGTDLTTNERFEKVGVERYTFDGGRIAEKDVYSRPA